MHKIVIPDALRAIADEKNFFLYQMPMKAPVGVSRVGVPKNTDDAAVSTLWEVVEKLEYLERKPEVLDRINRERAEWAQKADVAPRAIAGFRVGYVPREESAGVVVDMDKCVDEDGEVVVDDFALQEAFQGYRDAGGYWEVSPSGTGVRVVLPRVDLEDELRSDRREAGGVAFQAAQEKAKGFTLTLSGGGEWLRGDAGDRLVDEVVRVRDEGLVSKRSEHWGRCSGAEDEDGVALNWAHVGLEDLEGMLEVIPNQGEKFDERGWFVGMTKAIREAFEPRGLGEAAWDAWDAWVASREGGGYDYDWNRRVWDEPMGGGRSGEMSLAGLLSEAHERGWKGSWEADREDEGGEDGCDEGEGLDQDKEAVDWNDPWERFFIVAGDFFDLKTKSFKSDRAVDKMTVHFPMMWDNGKYATGPARSAWLKNKLRQADAVNFWPGKDRVFRGPEGRTLNTYTPLGEIRGGPDDCSVWKERVEEVFGTDEAERIFDWMAFVLQNPGKKVGWALVLLSEHEGAGKDFTLYPLVKALGRYTSTTSMHYLSDDKNAGVIFNKMFLLIEESAMGRFSDKLDLSEKLKTWIAGNPDTIQVRAMRTDVFEVQNVLNIALVGNQLDALHMETGTRRYYPVVTEYGAQLSNEEKRGRWTREWNWIESGKGDGWKAAARWLAQRDVRGRVTENMPAPTSKYLGQVVRAGMPPGAEWVEDYVQGRKWVTTQQIAEAGMGADMVSGVKVPTGKVLVRVLEGLGFKRLSSERVPVRIGERVRNFTVLGTGDVDKQEIYDALATGDDEIVDKVQKRGHLRVV